MSHNDTSKSNIKHSNSDDPFAFDDVDFGFGESPTDDIITLDEEVSDSDEDVWHMDCLCTKCAGKSGVDFDVAPNNDFVTTCPSCSNQVHVVRESHACRAKRKPFEIACARCGSQLDNHAHCPACGELFPDYFVAIDPVAVRKKARSESYSRIWGSIKELNFSFSPSFDRSASDRTIGQYTPVSDSSAPGSSSTTFRAIAIRAVLLIAAIALIVAGKFSYDSYKAGQLYAENYVKALYCIKTGVDTNLTTCSAAKAEWEAATRSGLSYTPRTSTKYEAKSAKLHGEVDKYLQKINDPPKKFLQANGILLEIHKIYLASEALVQTKPASLQGLNDSIEGLAKNMDQASQKLKSTLPDSLKAELATAKLKYRGMKDF